MQGRWELTDEQWQLIEPILRPARRADNRGRPWHDTRAVLNGVLWVLGTGAQWREMPEKYPPFQTCHRRFQQWVRGGKLEKALQRLARYLHERGQLNLDEAFVDATFASAKKGGLRSVPPGAARARRSSLSPLVTVFPLAVSVDSASPAECQLVEQVLGGSFLNQLPARLIGDKAYDSDALDEKLADQYRIELIAPNRQRRSQTQRRSPAAPLSQALESRTAVCLDAQVSPSGRAMGIPHRQLSRLRAPCLSPSAA